MNTLDAAVKYVEQNHWSVIPLRPNSKVPLIPWQEYQKRFPTMSELKKWFENSRNNIGIVTGKISNIGVLDVDSEEALKYLNSLTSSIIVITKRGRHFYFLHTGEVNSASKIAEKVDIRGEGGFVVAPPSSVDGHKYRFLNPYFRIDTLPCFPIELKERLKNVDHTNIDGGNSNGHHPLSFKETLGIIESGGPRTPNFVKAIGSLIARGYAPDDIYALLTPLARDREYDLSKLREAIEDIHEKDQKQNQGRQTTGYVQYRPEDKTEDIVSFLQGEEKVEWLIPGIIAKSSFGFLGGLPETWKSWILIDLALEAARGGNWLGYKAEKCKVLFIDQERFKADIKLRIKKLMKGKGMTVEDIKNNLVVQSGTTTRLDLPASFEAFRHKLQEIRPNLLILDSFATFHICSENDRTEIQQMLEKVKELRSEFGCAILFVDHENKGVLSPEMRGEAPTAFSIVGSVGKPAAAEVVLTTRKASDNSVTLYNTKNSLAQAVPPITLQLVDTENDGIRLVTL